MQVSAGEGGGEKTLLAGLLDDSNGDPDLLAQEDEDENEDQQHHSAYDTWCGRRGRQRAVVR